MNKSILRLVLCFLTLSQSGCSLLVGNIRPVEEKSDDYRVLDLAKTDKDWLKLGANQESNETSDLTFQSQSTASIVSLNSACRPSAKGQEHNLREFTQELLLGISNVSHRSEKEITVSNTPALETTVKGNLNDEPMMLRTVILKKGLCIYDLMYVARPEHFEAKVSDFSRFVSSLQLK